MVSAGNSPQVRYSVAYSTDAERMLRRETKTTVAIKCDPVAPPEMTTWMIVGIVVGAFPVSEFSHKPVANMIHYTLYESGQ